MSASKRDSATQIIRYLRVELRELDLSLIEDGLLPEPGQIRALLAQLDALHDLVHGIKKKQYSKVNVQILILIASSIELNSKFLRHRALSRKDNQPI